MQEGAYARRNDPETSHEAADRVRVSRLEGICLDALLPYPKGLEVTEISDLTKVPDKSVSPRMRRLVEKGLVFENGRRKNRNGFNQIVWVHHIYRHLYEPEPEPPTPEAPPPRLVGKQENLF